MLVYTQVQKSRENLLFSYVFKDHLLRTKNKIAHAARNTNNKCQFELKSKYCIHIFNKTIFLSCDCFAFSLGFVCRPAFSAIYWFVRFWFKRNHTFNTAFTTYYVERCLFRFELFEHLVVFRRGHPVLAYFSISGLSFNQRIIWKKLFPLFSSRSTNGS